VAAKATCFVRHCRALSSARRPAAVIRTVANSIWRSPSAHKLDHLLGVEAVRAHQASLHPSAPQPSSSSLAAARLHGPLSTWLYTALQTTVGTLLGHPRRYPLISLHYFRCDIATVERREASVPRHGTQGASLGAWRAASSARSRASLTHQGTPNGCRCTRTSLGALLPSVRGDRSKRCKSPGAENAPRERGGAF
jgi:hypothetical protein